MPADPQCRHCDAGLRPSDVVCPTCGAPRVVPLSERTDNDSLRSLWLAEIRRGPIDRLPIVVSAVIALLAVPVFGAAWWAMDSFVGGESHRQPGWNGLIAGWLIWLGVSMLNRVPVALQGRPRRLTIDHRLPIVYLRPFDTDREPEWARPPNPWTQSKQAIVNAAEVNIRAAVDRLGPLVALRGTTDLWPRRGAIRVSAGDNWHRLVQLSLANSQAAIFQFMDGMVSDATVWEWQEARRYLPTERIFVVLTDSAASGTWIQQIRYEVVCERLGIPLPVPHVPAGDFVLCFDRAGAPVMVSSQSPPADRHWTADALGQALFKNGLLPDPPAPAGAHQRPWMTKGFVATYVAITALMFAALVWRGQRYLEEFAKSVEARVADEFTERMRNASTPTPSEVWLTKSPFWKALSNGLIPPDAILGNADVAFHREEPWYVCRAWFGRDIRFGRLLAGRCHVRRGGRDEELVDYEVAVGNGSWARRDLAGAFIGGWDGGPVFVCRTKKAFEWKPGRLLLTGSCDIGSDGLEPNNAEYELFYLAPGRLQFTDK